MKQYVLLASCLLLSVQASVAQKKKLFNETHEQRQQRMAWWTHDRFGLFIHWGLYALPARHEWVRHYEKTKDADYQKYFDQFEPDLFDAKEWARMAKAAGMKYAVLTTKHHEGFCLFDSKYTDFKATNTSVKRDLVKEFVTAFRAEGIKVGFYYSLIDWHHPDYTIDHTHPLRPAGVREYDSLNAGKDMAKYRNYMRQQVTELLTNYGQIDLLWFDYSFGGPYGKGNNEWGAEALLKLVRKLQPQIIVNDRLDLREFEDGSDFVSPEQYKVAAWPTVDGKQVPWETCQTFSGSWGYSRDEYTWKSDRQLLVLLIESISKGGNLLLNVGPTARGYFDKRAVQSLSAMGKWIKLNGRSIYGCTQAPVELKCPDNCLLTYNPITKRLYVHLLEYPLQRLVLAGLKGKVKYVQFLHDGSEIKLLEGEGYGFKQDGNAGDLKLSLPVIKPDVEIPVVELVLNDN